jgi:hypothetical protein
METAMGYKEEFVTVDKKDPVRQGDLFKIEQDDSNNIDQFGVIITADCDIAQNKIGQY